jgi:hypothetical protein
MEIYVLSLKIIKKILRKLRLLLMLYLIAINLFLLQVEIYINRFKLHLLQRL